jgi:hypothetical protein
LSTQAPRTVNFSARTPITAGAAPAPEADTPPPVRLTLPSTAAAGPRVADLHVKPQPVSRSSSAMGHRYTASNEEFQVVGMA